MPGMLQHHIKSQPGTAFLICNYVEPRKSEAGAMVYTMHQNVLCILLPLLQAGKIDVSETHYDNSPGNGAKWHGEKRPKAYIRIVPV